MNRIETKILSGKTVAQNVYENLTDTILSLSQKGIVPGLAVILVGDDPPSQVYVRSKTKRFSIMNLNSETIRLPVEIDELDLINKIHELNNNDNFHGILVQLPLPGRLNTDKKLSEVDPKKDVDGFHPVNLGLLTRGKPRFIPCTPKGILEIFRFYGIQTDGKHVVVLGRSDIVGRPISLLLSTKSDFGNATVTICHSRTKDIGYYTRQADIIISAVGVPKMITRTMIKENVTIIDVGINRIEDDSIKGYHLVGDMDFVGVLGKAGAITPVPGGVGVMTIAMLVQNTVEAAQNTIR